MSLVPFEGLLESIVGVISKYIPDTAAQNAAKAELATLLVTSAVQEDSQQADIDKVEAANESLFVSGARPFILWVCGLAFAGHFIVLPTFLFFQSCWHSSCVAPAFDIAELNSVLYALLGIGGLRTVDKSVSHIMKSLK